MNLAEIINRSTPPEPWSEGDNIPWDEPGFSERMLQEHLSQDHDLASRRLATIDRHVAWIHAVLLGGRSGAHIFDMGCGPGLYGERMALFGHNYTGMDFSPASLAYARKSAADRGLTCTYIQGDLRQASFGADESFDLVMQIFGEINVFRPSHTRLILAKAYSALKPGGRLLLEASTEQSLRNMGKVNTSWFTSRTGLFSDRPHIVLEETFWEEKRKTVTNRYYIIDAASAQVERFACSYQAYTVEEYHKLLTDSGFKEITIYPVLGESPDEEPAEMLAITAVRPE
jgi:SAM-dependent methyltransferase